MDELVRRLEAATGPDRKLDEELFVLAHGRNRRISSWEQYEPPEPLPAYTRSIDAALALIPEHYSIEMMESAAGPPTFSRCRLWDWRHSPTMSDPGNEWKSEGNRPLPINVCAAALHARKSA